MQNFEEELTCLFKTDMGNLINFDAGSWKSENLHLMLRYRNEQKVLV